MSKVFVVYVSPLEMGSTEDKLVDLPMEQEALRDLLLEMGPDRPCTWKCRITVGVTS